MVLSIFSYRYDPPLNIVWGKKKLVHHGDRVFSEMFNYNKSKGIVTCTDVFLVKDSNNQKLSIKDGSYRRHVENCWGESMLVSHDQITKLYLKKDGYSGLQSLLELTMTRAALSSTNSKYKQYYLEKSKNDIWSALALYLYYEYSFEFTFYQDNNKVSEKRYSIKELVSEHVIDLTKIDYLK
ncbi:hypothetical protein [Apilactobacillus xinyiensis]|uniref:hypothetical protein n=1 Tax=Apilactobacillus xinyiensis TaxID=2841032 RepID=UPI003365200A